MAARPGADPGGRTTSTSALQTTYLQRWGPHSSWDSSWRWGGGFSRVCMSGGWDLAGGRVC